MKNIFIYSSIVVWLCAVLACSKDLGNYEYKTVNQLSLNGIDTINGYRIFVGDTLMIQPQLVGTTDQSSQGDYTYAWSVALPSVNQDSVISTERNLRARINLSPGEYKILYRVTDRVTGIQFHARARLNVSTEVYEGYLVLSDVSGKSRLDMLSYDQTGAQFNQYTDVLRRLGSALPEQGKPLEIFNMQRVYGGEADDFGIYLLSESGTSRLHPETFAYTPQSDLRYEMIGDIPSGFKAKYIGGSMQYGLFPNQFMIADQGLYLRSASPAFTYVAVNTYAPSAAPFPIAPYVITDANQVILYDVQKRAFASTDFYSTTSSEIPPAFNYPSGNNLVYMEYNYSGNAYAVLDDPASSAYYLLRFTMGGAASYYEEITGQDIDKAEHFAVSPDLGYLFYSVAGKLYEYDLSLKTSKQMLDNGNADITYLAFQNFFNRDYNPTYADWSKLLTVGIYNASGSSATSGTLEQYAVPTVNGQIQLKNRWTGFGKIASITYRER